MKHYRNIGLGGTFDRLHDGHKLFLDIAAHYGEFIHVGLISESYLKTIHKEYKKLIQDYFTRKKEIEHYLSQQKISYHISSVDYPGMDHELANEPQLDALVVSQETYPEAVTINHLRSINGKPRLSIIISPRVIRTDGSLESSTKQRRDEIEKRLG